MEDLAQSFTDFMNESSSRIQHALMASMGPELGQEAAAEAFAYGWEHWPRLCLMDNPAGYLYRVGRTRGRRLGRRLRSGPASRPIDTTPWVEPALSAALDRLTEKQRIATVLVHAGGWSFAEVAELLGLDRGTIQKHATRGLAKLKASMKVRTHV